MNSINGRLTKAWSGNVSAGIEERRVEGEMS